jgi:transcription termination/antitermination protein NusG
MFYVVQVITKTENKFLDLASSVIEEKKLNIFWPRRNLRIKKKGKWLDSLTPIFPGYLFINIDKISTDIYWGLKKIPGFLRFLKDNHNITPLPKREAEIISKLIRFGEIIEKSIVTFTKNNRINVIEGPLKGLEGIIVKIDKRKGRAKIKLDLYKESYLVDFGFQSISKK